MKNLIQTSEQAVASLLTRIAETAKKQRLSNNTSQADQAEIASISIKALQKIETGESGNSLVLFKYLYSLNLLHILHSALPDPTELTPIEKMTIQTKNKKMRASRKKQTTTFTENIPTKKTIEWGDEK
jgi:transcriptional regulator with XRE-family HTH domain